MTHPAVPGITSRTSVDPQITSPESLRGKITQISLGGWGRPDEKGRRSCSPRFAFTSAFYPTPTGNLRNFTPETFGACNLWIDYPRARRDLYKFYAGEFRDCGYNPSVISG